MAEFGEIMHFKIPHTKLTPGKFEDVWADGVWLGVDLRSGENFIGTDVGVFRVSTVRRMPEDKRWSVARVAEEMHPQTATSPHCQRRTLDPQQDHQQLNRDCLHQRQP